MSKHTPAPWRKIYIDGEVPQVFAKHMRVATVIFDCDVDSITAVPEMLKALYDARTFISKNIFSPYASAFCGELSDIIAKAEGEE